MVDLDLLDRPFDRPGTPTPKAHTPPKARARNPSIDRARTFLTLVVLLHHAVIPYTYFGHTDPKSWIGFDMIVLTTDLIRTNELQAWFLAVAVGFRRRPNDGNLRQI
jgi:hypothetical protein